MCMRASTIVAYKGRKQGRACLLISAWIPKRNIFLLKNQEQVVFEKFVIWRAVYLTAFA